MDAQFGGEDQRKIFTFAEKVSSVVVISLSPLYPHMTCLYHFCT